MLTLMVRKCSSDSITRFSMLLVNFRGHGWYISRINSCCIAVVNYFSWYIFMCICSRMTRDFVWHVLIVIFSMLSLFVVLFVLYSGNQCIWTSVFETMYLRTMHGKNVSGHVSDDVAPSGQLNDLDDDVYLCWSVLSSEQSSVPFCCLNSVESPHFYSFYA